MQVRALLSEIFCLVGWLVLSWRAGGKAHCIARGETEMVSNSCLRS